MEKISNFEFVSKVVNAILADNGIVWIIGSN
jgi:hypothetical protein